MSLSASPVAGASNDSYDELLQMYLTVAATWIDCNERVIRSRYQLLQNAFRACKQPETVSRLKLAYDGEFVEPPHDACAQTFITSEIEVLSNFFQAGAMPLFSAGTSNSDLNNEIRKAIRAILMLPNTAGVVRGVTRTPTKMTDAGMKALAMLYKRSKHRAHPETIIPDLIITETLAPSLTVAIAAPSIPVVAASADAVDDEKQAVQAEIDLVKEALIISVEQSAVAGVKVLPPYDELIEGVIAKLHLPPVATRTMSRTLDSVYVAWNNGTIENLTAAEAIDACELAYSLENLTIKHASIGSPVAKVFNEGLYYGQVVYYAMDDVLYHVEWSDGDSEDMDWDEFRHATALYHRNTKSQALLNQLSVNEMKRKYVYQEGCLHLTVNMKVAKLVPLAVQDMSLLSAATDDVIVQEVHITAKHVTAEEEANMTVKHPSIGKSLCRLLSLRNRHNKTVHRNLVLSGMVTGYIPHVQCCGTELYRLKWDNIDEQQWLNYTEVTNCTALKIEELPDVPPKKKRCLNKFIERDETAEVVVAEEML